MYLVVVDSRTTEDLMGWKSIARALRSRVPDSGGIAFVHAPGELAERILEEDGVALRGDDGMLAADDEADREILVRAVRTENRRNVSQLSEEGVSAVGFIGGERGLFGTGEKLPWIADVTAAGAVPVVSSLIDGKGGTREIPIDEAVSWLARELDAQVVCLADESSTRTGNRRPLSANAARSPRLARALKGRGINVLFTTVSGIADLGGGG